MGTRSKAAQRCFRVVRTSAVGAAIKTGSAAAGGAGLGQTMVPTLLAAPLWVLPAVLLALCLSALVVLISLDWLEERRLKPASTPTTTTSTPAVRRPARPIAKKAKKGKPQNLRKRSLNAIRLSKRVSHRGRSSRRAELS
ncbi:hypothetical protein [Solimonas terrae]|uniref:Uncharacterized protein n=1 Tax=Solimonas terrae TaxID=1396819 RepID=A0A6M2BQ29_9GAMM|nr:hypothetical protein [Solimonas terrae]NGY04558.1 hypothetical protein [Solimonas terrae]